MFTGTIATLLLWYGASLYDVHGLGPPVRPDRVLRRTLMLCGQQQLQSDFLATAYRVALASMIGAVAAITWGFTVGLSGFIEGLTRPILYAAQSIPLVVLGLIFLLVMGPTSGQAIAFVAFTVFLQMAPPITSEVQAVNWNYLRIGRTHRFGMSRTIAEIILPSVQPALFDIFRSALIVAWSFMAFAEAMGGEVGLGLRINELRRFDHSTDMFVYILVIATCIVSADILLRGAKRWACPWLYRST